MLRAAIMTGQVLHWVSGDGQQRERSVQLTGTVSRVSFTVSTWTSSKFVCHLQDALAGSCSSLGNSGKEAMGKASIQRNGSSCCPTSQPMF